MQNILNCDQSQLVVIDVQEKLAGAMPAEAFVAVLNKQTILLQAAQILAVKTIITEQYPQGLGATLSELTVIVPATKTISKTAFSACKEPAFVAQMQRDKSQIVLCGMEAHICVLQTALDLLHAGKTVYVVEDSIISRDPANKANAVARLQSAGCVITNTESVVFEWLGNANHQAFKAISKLIK